MQIEIPKIGLGTWQLYGKECTNAVTSALNLGYRHIDTAHLYENHKAIAKALKGHPRDELFITSKFITEQIDQRHIEKSVAASLDKALKELKTDYLDLYLLHWPDRKSPYLEMVAAMQELLSSGKCRYIGVSNFTIHHLKDIVKAGISVSFNQVEFHPHLNQKELLHFCQKHHIQLIAFRPLGKGKLVHEPTFKEIGQSHNKTAAQVLLRWCLQKNIPFVVKAKSPKHQKDNLAIYDFNLTHDEMHTLDHITQTNRYCYPEWEDFDY